MSVATMDFDAFYAEVREQIVRERKQRLAPALVRLWDGDWNFRGKLQRIISANVIDLDNETGTATFDIPRDYWMADWVVNFRKRSTQNIHVTVDKDGVRWSGRMESFTVIKNEDGTSRVRLLFKHDYEELKHILAFANPWLPPEVQFPRMWRLYGPSRWALKMTLFANLVRIQGKLWTIPDDPLDPSHWVNLDQKNWTMMVKPSKYAGDTSLRAIVHSRFKNMHEVSKKIVADAQLSWECRRWLEGDPEPWPGAKVRHGTLIFDLVDKSGFTTGTSFGGSLFDGLIRELVNIGPDGDKGFVEGIDIINDPTMPPEYSQPGFQGTLPVAPWVIYRDNVRSGIQSSQFTYRPPTDVSVVAGGHSMAGVNELMSAAIQMAGDLTATIPFAPPLGGVADAFLKPLYTDTIAAFGKWNNNARAQKLGSSHYKEKFAEGGDRAYSLAWLLAMRSGMWDTREQTAHEVTVADGAPYRIGQQGYGHFYKGDRIGTTVMGMEPGRVFVDRVSKVQLSWDRNTAPIWQITIGQREIQDPAVKAMELIQGLLSNVQDLGLV
ncbi:phage tail protein [Rhodococcus hoagii]|uniref:Phage tail protein n=1 Tax=Rhodococcus hoagii TaxID=43767 RepID=A0A9Q5EW17_RHOHA|nr:phage tail protein [Prescottella equi]NKT77235.1 phage tail protein [Prescottella equi]NKZ81019.1 phage tail protein [Prescottella equi]